MNNGGVPFLDLVTPHLELRQELVAVFEDALRTAGFIGGPMVERFEREFAQFCETRYCAGVGSGTDALLLALMAAGVQPGDAVVTVPNTFIATTEAITQAGAHPAFVDIDPRTYNMDPDKLREYLQQQCAFDFKTRKLIHRPTRRPVTAIVPVHLYGQMADMDPILELAAHDNLLVVEDACQAHGAEYFSQQDNRWHKAGSMGRAAAFSFYPGKNLGACGEAGAVTTNDEELAGKVRMLRDHGQARKYYHDMEGYNGRLDAIQAGILSAKLRQLLGWNEKRQEKALEYNRRLQHASGGLTPPQEPSWSKAVYHLYVIRSQAREALRVHLGNAGIGTGIHYPIPLHLQKAYKELGYRGGDFPVAERAAAEILSLPMYPQLEAEQQSRVAKSVLEFVSRRAARRVEPLTAPEMPSLLPASPPNGTPKACL